MKWLSILLLGICLGIGGEFIIPSNFRTTVAGGCISQKSDGRTYMPELLVYDPKFSPVPIQVGRIGSGIAFVPSYRWAYALLTKEVSYLDQDKCNALIQKYWDDRNKK